MDTLILNNDGSPVSLIPLSVVSWQESIKYMWLDRVTVLEWYDDWIVSSPSWETKVPAVMMVKDFIKRRQLPSFSKYNLSLRDMFTCQYCDKLLSHGTVTLDHVLPVSKGGKTSWENVVASCGPCNHKKGNKFQKPLREPRQPTYYELAANRRQLPFTIKHPSWETYI